MTNHTANRAAGKNHPAGKPYPDFPLSLHTHTGRYYKKIHGVRYYFGKIADGSQAALDLYEQQRDDLHAGRTPRTPSDGLTVKALLNEYTTAKERQRDSGEIEPRTCDAYLTAISTACGTRSRPSRRSRPEIWASSRR